MKRPDHINEEDWKDIIEADRIKNLYNEEVVDCLVGLMGRGISLYEAYMYTVTIIKEIRLGQHNGRNELPDYVKPLFDRMTE